MSGRYDVAILNASLVDGTGTPAREVDIAIRNGRIARIGTLDGPANQTIDAYGQLLTPGFVDLHGHSDHSLLLDPFARSKVFQGVTTEVGGNGGTHAAPVFGSRSSGLTVDWSSSEQYRARLQHEQPSINFAMQVGYNSIRSSVASDPVSALTASERQKVRRLVREELEAGSAGLSFGLAHSPGCDSQTEELVDVAEEATRAGAVASFHLRNEDHRLLEAVEEALQISRTSKAAIHIGSLKTFKRPTWRKIDPLLKLLREARESGVDLTVDRYPHLAVNAELKLLLPAWAREGGSDAVRKRLSDQATRKRIVTELTEAADDARDVLLLLVSSESRKRREGKFLDDLAGPRNPWEVLCELVAEEGDTALATIFGMSPENLDRILELEFAIVASDTEVQAIERQLGDGRPHPRCFDTFPYFLAEWVFARRKLELPTAIRKMTQLPALRAGLKDRGVVVEGAFADLVLLNPSAMQNAVSYEQPVKYPSGIVAVLVNGRVVLLEGRHTGERPGRLLTREIRA